MGTIVGQQLRVVTGALRQEVRVLAAALILLCLFAALGGFGRDPLVGEPSFLLLALPVAAILPIAVWRGESLFGRAYLWTLPARRQGNAFARIFAGAVWLVVAIGVTMLTIAVIAWASGGHMGITEVRLVSATANPAAATKVTWTTPAWEYIAPFTACLIVYGLATAAVVGLRYPLRWVLGIAFTWGLLIALLNLPGTPLAAGVDTIREHLWFGRYGLDKVLSGVQDYRLQHEFQLPNGSKALLWSSLPSPAPWLRSTAAWMAGTLLLITFAVRRHAER
ncbi:hypothetical protein G7078_02560 [Sphingomonas sinipercae]|uniref:Uncharacterized protein n=1 Tax=Sphingomonas sinipercae TaxID=2714944 RepID=A0A6G7ZLK2_9SPHN|nr:hypothetical protein [Sphingomonas sinipercae]QIL01776.1 hypothetical protein G7078_02560 [Sphingomonas sinipercae]